MAAPKLTFDSLKRQIASGQLAPVYIISGTESYFTDELVKEFEKVIPDSDKGFNQYVLYAPQVLPGQVMDLCYQYPLMSDRKVVILKEAQAVKADVINKLAKYCSAPSGYTTFVIVFRGQKAAGKDLIAAVKKNGVFFESTEVREYAIGPYISSYVSEKCMRIDPKALEMLKEFIGGSVSKMYNELEKLYIILGANATITPEAVELNVGISKDYNSYELVDAIAARNAEKAYRIANYFASNPKAYPSLMMLPSIYDFFSNLLILFYAKDKSQKGLMAELKIQYDVQFRKYREGMRNYNAFQVIEAIWAIRRCDVMIKGNGSRQGEYDLFHDLLFHILTAPGNLGVSDLYI